VTRPVLGVCAAVAAAFALTGCGTVGLSAEGEGDTVRGKELFVDGCGQCHALADANTQGVIGPNLDDAFVQPRADGLGENTIQSVVRTQIAYPVEEPSTGTPGMPADIYEGDDAEAVAAYVASVAGLPAAAAGTDTGGTDTGGGAETGGGTETGGDAGAAGGTQETGGDVDGAAVFTEAGCGSCHTFEAAGSTGTIGPNLDEAAPSTELAIERVTAGMGAMPAFGDRLSPEQIRAVAEYVSQTAG
jgi:mono/diheme cytochrome c family protein